MYDIVVDYAILNSARLKFTLQFKATLLLRVFRSLFKIERDLDRLYCKAKRNMLLF